MEQKAKARIKGTPFIVEVSPFCMQMDNFAPIGYNRFSGFVDDDNTVYSQDELEFLDVEKKEEKLDPTTALLCHQRISVRAINILKWAFYDWEPNKKWEEVTVSDLAKRRKIDLIRLRNFGRKSFGEVCDLMRKYGIEFKEEY